MKVLKKLSQWYFTRNALPYGCILLLDSICVYLAGVLCYYLENGGDLTSSNFWQITLGMLIALVIYIASFRFFHTYREVLRFSSFADLQRTIIAMIVASVFVFGLHLLEIRFALSNFFMAPDFRAVCFTLVVATMLMWLVRILVKNCYDFYRTSDNTHRVFIYGAMSGGIALAKSVLNTPDSPYTLAGIVSTDAHVAKSWMLGIKVSLDSEELPKQMKAKGADVLLVSPIQTEHFRARTSLIDALIKEGIKIMMMPAAEEWDGYSNLSHSQLKEVEIEDLLPREKIEVDLVAIGQMLRGRRILITGAAGSIGSEMARQVAKFQPAELVLVDQAETPMHDVRLYMANNHKGLKCLTIVSSITDQEHMEKIFSEYKPEYVFHAAAYKHVPMMERSEEHTSELQSRQYLVCRLLLEKKKGHTVP